jgi:hypothetical protein
MVFTAKDYVEIIDEEIKWIDKNICEIYESEYEKYNEIYKSAFIAGLQKAIFLINQTRILR